MNRPVYYQAPSQKLFMEFITHLVAPRKKQVKNHSKPNKRAWTTPHQSTREKQRRLRQREKGMLHF